MTLPASGQISLLNIATEFGGAAPHSLSEYYRGGGLVYDLPANAAIPTSGAIKLSDFYSASNKLFTLRNTGIFSVNPCSNIAFNGTWLEIAQDQIAATTLLSRSLNTITWGVVTSPLGSSMNQRDIASNGAGLFATSVYNAGTINPAATSTDGSTYTSRAVAGWPAGGANCAAYGNGVFVISSGNRFATSADGISWTDHGLQSAVPFRSGNIVFAGSFFFTANASSGGFYYSSNGATWAFVNPTVGINGFRGVAYDPNSGLYVMTGPSGKVIHSSTPTSAASWVAASVPVGDAAREISSIAWGNGRFIYGTDGVTFASSASGSSFTTIATNFTTGSIRRVAYLNGYFFALGDVYISGNQHVGVLEGSVAPSLP